MTRAELLFQIYREADEAIEQHFSKVPNWPCVPGCSRCCEENLFLVGSLEFKVIHKHLLAWSNYHISRLQKRVDRALSRLQNKHQQLFEFMVYIESNRRTLCNKDQLGLMLKYESLCQSVKDVACPFLYHGSCSIYGYRPIVCRTYGKTYDVIEASGLVKYNICEKLNNSSFKSHLLNGTYMGIEIDLLSYNRDRYPLPVWLAKALPNISVIPNEQREFGDPVLSLDEFRLLQKYLRRNKQNACDQFEQDLAIKLIQKLTSR